MERADEVLALGQVHPGLATDRRIDLRDERRRDRDERDATEVDRGQEAGRVPERPAAERDEHLRAVDAEGREFARRGLDHREALGVLARRQKDVDDVAAVGRQLGRQPLPDGVPRARLGDDDGPARVGTVELGGDSLGRDPRAQDDPPDRRVGAQQHGPTRSAARRGLRRAPRRELRLHSVDDALHLGHAELGDGGRGVEPLALRPEVAERADRVPPRDERADVR